MTNRRQFLRSAAALSSLQLVQAPLARALEAAEPSTLTLERFVFDARFAEPGAIAETVERLGVPLSPVADDLMSLWYDELDLAWREKPMALAGVTLAEALFVLETFALDRGMHVVYRGEHGLVENGRITHRLAGPAAWLDRLELPPAGWESALGTALCECPLGAKETRRVELETAGAALSQRDVALHSWIIAPRSLAPARVERWE